MGCQLIFSILGVCQRPKAVVIVVGADERVPGRSETYRVDRLVIRFQAVLGAQTPYHRVLASDHGRSQGTAENGLPVAQSLYTQKDHREETSDDLQVCEFTSNVRQRI